MNRRHAVFLDRDGVINRARVVDGKPYPPNSLAELELIPDANRALGELRREGFLLLVVTNQPDISRGKQDPTVVQQMHGRLQSELPLDGFYVCPHDDRDGCNCRKPAPGLLLQAAGEWNLDLNNCFLIGDRWRDVAAAQNAGCRSVFIDYDYNERRPNAPTTTVRSLPQAVSWILEERQRERTSLAS